MLFLRGRPAQLASMYRPIVLGAEINAYGLWVVTLSVAPGLRLPVTCCRLGVSRSEAIAAALAALGS